MVKKCLGDSTNFLVEISPAGREKVVAMLVRSYNTRNLIGFYCCCEILSICQTGSGTMMNPRYWLFFFIFFICSCASVKKEIRESKELLAVDPDLKASLKGSGPIELLEHQLIPIDYLRRHPELHGLLVNHYMGTGKTFLGIGFIQSFSERPILVIAPSFLESQWIREIKRFGVKNPERIIFTSYQDLPKVLKTIDIKNYVVIADEVHNLVKNIRSIDPKENAAYTNAYLELLNCYKFIGLSGTPVYGDESDLAYMVNLVSGYDLMPFNQESFRLQYTKVLPARKFFRGYFLENNILQFSLPGFLGLFAAGLFGQYFLPIGIVVGAGLTVGLPFYLDTDTFKFRELEVEKMEPVMNKYISYFKYPDEHFEDFPTQKFTVRDVPYNKYQYSFFLRLVEGDLPVNELQRLLVNSKVHRSDKDVAINSSQIHEQIYSTVGAGRDIGNFEFYDDGKIVEAPKFEALYKEILAHDEPTVLYSNYFDTGILAFEKFLKRKGFERPYGIIEPSMKPEQVGEMVDAYNHGKIKLLMLHPDVTEGISLKGTQFLHILEPTLNSTVREQIIGRALRFQSHSHLPKEKQVVNVNMWRSESSSFDPEIVQIKRANWFKRYNELSYMSRWGLGMYQIDKNYAKKALNPEELSYVKMQSLEKNLSEIQKALNLNSIENLYKKQPPVAKL